MNNQTYESLMRRIWVVSLILAPLLILISQFFWQNGVLTATAGWLQVLAFTFWIPAFHGMFSMVKNEMPRYAAIGFLVAIYACIGGNNFGVDGIYNEAMGITGLEDAGEFKDKMGLGGVVALFLPGLLFPLSLLVLGVMLILSKNVPGWLGVLLIIAAIGFPASRMPREPLVAHIDNVLLLVSHSLIAVRMYKNHNTSLKKPGPE